MAAIAILLGIFFQKTQNLCFHCEPSCCLTPQANGLTLKAGQGLTVRQLVSGLRGSRGLWRLGSLQVLAKA